MKTFLLKIDKQQRAWHIVDAEGLVLGRIAEKVANILRGRNKPTYTPHLDAGDFVIVINAEKVRVTGRKEAEKEYQRFSGHRGTDFKAPTGTPVYAAFSGKINRRNWKVRSNGETVQSGILDKSHNFNEKRSNKFKKCP